MLASHRTCTKGGALEWQLEGLILTVELAILFSGPEIGSIPHDLDPDREPISV